MNKLINGDNLAIMRELPSIGLKNLDCFEYMATLPSQSINASIFDPPYGLLKGHKIETAIDIDKLAQEVYRVGKKDSFVAFFGQMPTLAKWTETFLKYFDYVEHITWAKRIQSSAFAKILRTHEDIIILRKGSPKLCKTKQKYEDIKLPAINFGIFQLESMNRVLTALRTAIKDGGKVKRLQNNKKKNDEYHAKVKEGFIYEEYPDECTIDNTWCLDLTTKEYDTVWSFVSQNMTGYGDKSDNFKHPTVKPILLAERLIELLTNEGESVLDMFSGTGTTMCAAYRLNRSFYGSELFSDYYEMSLKRLAKEKSINKLAL